MLATEGEAIDKKEARQSAPPNFVHSLDAAHLIKVVNRANAEGIANLVTVHDSFGCLAPQAGPLQKIINEELAGVYCGDPLGGMLKQNKPLLDKSPLGPVMWWQGWLDPNAVRTAKYAFGS